MTNIPPASREDLARFFALEPKNKDGELRGLNRVLRELKLCPIGGKLQWGLVWEATGLAKEQAPSHWKELTNPLWEAKDVADHCGVSSSIIYRWHKGKLPANVPPMPRAIDLSGGRKDARAMRWRKAEIIAWQNHQPQPAYARRKPVFGALLRSN